MLILRLCPTYDVSSSFKNIIYLVDDVFVFSGTGLVEVKVLPACDGCRGNYLELGSICDAIAALHLIGLMVDEYIRCYSGAP